MNRDDSIQVPILDLAPKLKRPLLLWNPLDYLRLLYWVFFVPQLLKRYKEEFLGNAHISQKYIELRLFLQGSILLLIVNIIGSKTLELLAININWYSVIISVMAGMILMLIGEVYIVGGIAFGIAFGITFGVSGIAANVAFGVAFSLVIGAFIGAVISAFIGMTISIFSDTNLEQNLVASYEIGSIIGGMFGGVVGTILIEASSANIGIGENIAGGIASGMSFGAAFGVSDRVTDRETFDLEQEIFESFNVKRLVSISLFSSIVFGIANSKVNGIASGIAFGLSFFLFFGIALIRPGSWLLETLHYFAKGRYWQEPHSSITCIPILSLSKQMSGWLEKDWGIGIHNANQFLAYTKQFIPVIKAVNHILNTTSSAQLLFKTSQLATNPVDWNLIRFSSASLSDNIKHEVIAGLFILPSFIKKQLTEKLSIKPRLDTPARATAAGFWYLSIGQASKAKNAFDLVADLPYGEEMRNLALTLANCNLSEASLEMISAISLPPIASTPHLHPASWFAIASLHRVIADIQVLQISISYSVRSFALNRAIGELDKLLKHPENLESAEKDLILIIAKSWQRVLLSASAEIITTAILKPIQNPYIIGDPVEGFAFIGREDVINQLSELWLLGQSLQSVVLYGHRRMGKTSILRNVHRHIGSSVHIVYINLLLLSNPQGEADVLIFICDEIQRVIRIETPQNSDFVAFPENTCRRYIQQICDRIDNQKLIIALDEFEQIENFITAGKISPDFLQFLRGLVQLSPKIAFAFAGLHTLEEMTADYFHPFFASVIPIRVGFLSRGSTRQLLANPDPDFLLDYAPDTLDAIYDLTAGQPYLTQLVGFQLVRHYNNQVFERGRPRDPVFTTTDLQTVIEDPEFFDRGRYYFTGIWQQAAQDTPHQQAILKAIAPAGLTLAELSTHTNLALADLQPALTMLDRHDVICYQNDHYYIAVELFRRWVLDRSPAI